MDDKESLLEQVRAWFERGEVDSAKEVVRTRQTREVRDANLHLGWADLCEELGLVDDVIQELNLALRDQPDSVPVLRRLAEIHQDNGNLDRAAKRWKEIILCDPGTGSHYARLGEIFEETRDYTAAAETYRLGFEKTGDGSLQARLRALDFLGGGRESEPAGPEESGEGWIPTDSQVVQFMDVFSGREGVYARQWVSPTGESGYTPIHEPFTMSVARNHLLGNHTAGLYPLRMDNTVCFIAFDIDIAKYFLAKAITNRKLWERAETMAQTYACRVVDLAAAHGMTGCIEDSGFKGRHVWLFLDTPVPARIARRFALLLVSQAGRPPSELQVEAFPKQGFVEEGKLGNLIKLPLGIHRRSGRRSVFVDGGGKPLPGQLGFPDRVTKTPKQKIYEFIQRFQVAETTPAALSAGQSPTSEKEAPVAPPLPVARDEYDLERDLEFQYLMTRCPVLRTIVEKVNQLGEIDSEERIVFSHSVGLLKHGPEAVNAILGRCANVDASFFLKSRLRGNPISCPKIRSRVPGITSHTACNCRFDPKTTLYPSPLLHIQEMDKFKTAPLLGQTIDSLQFQQLLQEYLKLRKQMRECEILLQTYEARLDEFFSQAGIDTVQTPMGTLRRASKEGEKAIYSLDI